MNERPLDEEDFDALYAPEPEVDPDEAHDDERAWDDFTKTERIRALHAESVTNELSTELKEIGAVFKPGFMEKEQGE